MRWILVILFLYIIPLWMLFKNNSNFKRSTIYGSMYIIVSSVIVISNIYISTLNKMENTLQYRSYASDEKHIKDIDNKKKTNVTELNNIQELPEVEKEAHNIDFQDGYDEYKEIEALDDATIVKEFKAEIYEIERMALIPMRECMPNLNNINISSSAINKAKQDIDYAKEMCNEVVRVYEEMDIPVLSNIEHGRVLEKSKLTVQKAYILRAKAMESSKKLLDTKNLKYIGEIKEYLRLSDEQIKNFVESIKILQYDISKIK